MASGCVLELGCWVFWTLLWIVDAALPLFTVDDAAAVALLTEDAVAAVVVLFPGAETGRSGLLEDAAAGGLSLVCFEGAGCWLELASWVVDAAVPLHWVVVPAAAVAEVVAAA